jgi:hypothetical protein
MFVISIKTGINLSMKKLKLIAWSILIVGLWSCSGKQPEGHLLTFLVTTNVRGQLDPCG